MIKSWNQKQQIQLRWLIRWRDNIIYERCRSRPNYTLILTGKILRTKEDLSNGFPIKMLGRATEYVCQYTSLVPAVGEKLRIRQKPFSEAVRESGSSVPLPSSLPWMMDQGSLF